MGQLGEQLYRVRLYVAEHPECTTDEVRGALGEWVIVSYLQELRQDGILSSGEHGRPWQRGMSEYRAEWKVRDPVKERVLAYVKDRHQWPTDEEMASWKVWRGACEKTYGRAMTGLGSAVVEDEWTRRFPDPPTTTVEVVDGLGPQFMGDVLAHLESCGELKHCLDMWQITDEAQEDVDRAVVREWFWLNRGRVYTLGDLVDTVAGFTARRLHDLLHGLVVDGTVEVVVDGRYRWWSPSVDG